MEEYIKQLTEFVTQYSRLDSDEEEPIELYLYGAIEYVKNATGVALEDMSDNFLYKLAIAMLFCHFYENRSIQTTENNANLKQSLTYIFLQLKHCYGEDDN